jgi:hypothetical protein
LHRARIGGADRGMGPTLEVVGRLAFAPEDFEAAAPRNRRFDRVFIRIDEPVAYDERLTVLQPARFFQMANSAPKALMQ